MTLASQVDSKVPPEEAGAHPSRYEGWARGCTKGCTRLLPGFLQSRWSMPAHTPQPTRSLYKDFHCTATRYEKQGEGTNRASSETSAAFPFSPPRCACSHGEEPTALSKRQQLGQAASVSESREMDFLNIWYSSAGSRWRQYADHTRWGLFLKDPQAGKG